MKPIGGGWVFVRKKPNGIEPPCFKAWYVARGNSQLSVQDFHETFAPTATFTSLCILLTIAAQSEMHVASFDFLAAYLNSSSKEEIWIWLKALKGAIQDSPGWEMLVEPPLYIIGKEGVPYEQLRLERLLKQ
ncbi:hypothetical protein O181_123802 [Austropuccinia psidii MF-1]|uniref:Reverse transcriptase Ty1/copia-type domain-containing protein n=1 Tax=Austropuccinia psidii MF-1 TaxID=1389203 RepID=A0A9Q3KQS4_9BASI|nr:hypothetical protein [Austropuccinia psidii MF-1]